jgi:hypothetical protein
LSIAQPIREHRGGQKSAIALPIALPTDRIALPIALPTGWIALLIALHLIALHYAA